MAGGGGRRGPNHDSFNPEEIEGKNPEPVITRCIRRFLLERLGGDPGVDGLEADIRAVLRLFENNVPEVARMRPHPPPPPPSSTTIDPFFRNDTAMQNYTWSLFLVLCFQSL